jgi:tRNA-2-methylthio-N6-dimethylallyladenosine synthase
MGRTECNRVINFAASAAALQRLPGQLIDIAVTQRMGFSLRGQLPLMAQATLS